MEITGEIRQLSDDIVNIVSAVKILLFSRKTNLSGELTSFKLIVIIPDGENEAEATGRIYTECDCDIPFDVVLYSESDWKKLSEEEDTFAHSAAQKGQIIYEGA